MKRILFFASTLFLLCYLSCVKEEEVDFKYPKVYTNPVSDITSSGARFAATIDFPNPDQITAFGFIWGEDSKLSGATFSLPPDSITSNLFYADIRSSLIDNKIYYVRSFVIKSGKTVYGNMVSFKSLGSEGPKITEIVPAIAAFGDTVHVIGKNFTSGAILKYGTQDISSSILKTDKNKLTFILPGSIPVSPAEDIISLTIEGNVSRSPLPLKLDLERILPKILSITPSVVKACDTITIRGKNFLLGNYPVEVSYNLGKLVVIKATKDSLVCIVKNIPNEEISFSIYNGRFYAYSQGIDLTEQRPQIISVSPLIYKSKDIITVKVKNFPYCDESMYVTTSNGWNGSFSHLPILSKSKEEIKIQLPEECLGYFSIIFVMEAGNYYSTQQVETPPLSPEPPEIYSIEPNHGSYGDEIVIKGIRLKDNLVSILDITSSSDTEVRGTLNQDAYINENGFVDVTLYGCGSLSKENAFKYDPIEISDFNPKLITSQSQLITITGKNFTSIGNTILIGSSTYQNINSDDHRTITIPASALIADASQNINQSLSITVQNAMDKMATSPIPLVINHEASWYRLMDFSYPGIHSGISFSAGGKGYAGIGSYSPEFWQYDPGFDSWQQVATFPGHGSGSSAMVSVSANGKGYVGLDITYNKEWWEYDPSTDSWNKKQDYPGALAQGAFAFEIGGKVYVGGGNGNYEFWEYNPATDTWARKTNLPGYGGRGTANFGFKGKGYIYGTSQNGSQYLENTYNPVSNTWTTRLIAPFEAAGDYQCMVFGNYVIINGVQLSALPYHNAFFKVTPGIGNLQIVPDYAGAPRLNHISFAIGNFGYFGLGQEANSFMESVEMWKFDPSKFK